ncbi:26S proteasome subunit PI31/PMSF1 [Acrasis kona]|uniref:26S proteasome subunit PI31/PMSF1 n=1 Tax=Acrasis kona TaxID=1008807 RepID=A0AAW2ZKY6_9EUKA
MSDNKTIYDILASPEVNSDQVKNEIKTEHDAMAYLAHLMMVQHGFRCVGLSEKSETKEHEQQYVLPDGWNASSDVYSFKYKHKQSSMNFVMKCVTLGNKLLINALTVEEGKHFSLEIDVKGHYKSTDQTDISDRYKDINEIESLFKNNISNKMVPYQHKEGYEATTPSQSQNTTTTTTTNTAPTSQQQPRQPVRPSRREDDYDPLRIGPVRRPDVGRMIPDVGSSDLYPSFAGPTRGVPGFGGGGMMVGPNHPGFGGGGMMMPGPGFGGRGALPPGVPQGARFDPYSPFGPRAPPGRANPNPDHFRPPQFEDDTSENPYWF